MSLARLGSYTFVINPDSIAWSYKLNTQQWDTHGGRVVQILSCSIEDVSVTGTLLSSDPYDKYEEMRIFQEFIIDTMRKQNETGKSIEFAYPPRGWKAKVFLKSYPSPKYDDKMIVPTFTLNLVVDEGFDGLADVTTAAEINKLTLFNGENFNGVRWKRSAKWNDLAADSPEWQQAYNELLEAYKNRAMFDTPDWAQTAIDEAAKMPEWATETQGATSEGEASRVVESTSGDSSEVGVGVSFNSERGLQVEP